MIMKDAQNNFILLLPATFIEDHLERCADHPGYRGHITKIGSRRLLTMDAIAVADLISDTEYYAGNCAPDWEDGAAIRRSARTTLAALKRQGIM